MLRHRLLPLVQQHPRPVPGSLLVLGAEKRWQMQIQSRRNTVSQTVRDLGRKVTRLGFWGSKGIGRPGYPRTTPIRVPGLDPNLQERLDELYKEQNERRRNRKDIGFPPMAISTPGNDRKKMLEFRRQRRSDSSLEKAARERTLEVDLDDVRRVYRESGALYVAIREAADLYGIYDDLFGLDSVFTPCLDLRVEYDYGEEYITPVYRGNIIKPSDASNTPAVGFELPPHLFENESGGSPEDSLWTLVMTNPDGHFVDENAEYLHWMVGNIRGNDVSSGETVVNYMQPFPPFGTGYHRYIFVLCKQSEKLDFSPYHRPSPCHSLVERTFSTPEFFRSKVGRQLKPAGLAFFQSDWDPSLKVFFQNTLNMKEPRYEYHFLQPYVTPWTRIFDRKFRDGFNLFLDRHRDPKEIQEELVKKKLATFHPFRGDLTARHRRFPNVHIIDPHLPQWRRREIERERLREGIYKDLDWGHLRRDPTHS